MSGSKSFEILSPRSPDISIVQYIPKGGGVKHNACFRSVGWESVKDLRYLKNRNQALIPWLSRLRIAKVAGPKS